MSEPFIGQIQPFAFNFAPRGWALCDGQLIPISQNTALFSLIGTTYGGDGRTTFALPDLRGRVPIHQGHGPGQPSYVLGQSGGLPTNFLTTAEMPSHTHAAVTHCQSGAGNSNAAASNVWSKDAGSQTLTYSSTAPDTTMNAGAVTISATGGSTSVNNMQPYLTINFSICMLGLYPPRS